MSSVAAFYSQCYSDSYAEARERFLEAARHVDAKLLSYELRDQENDLSIDVAIVGPSDAPAVLVSSGVHGVEGFFGSAAQFAMLRRFNELQKQPVKYILLHAVNPYGFANIRRFNEMNIDLNRNFRIDDVFAGAPDGYAELMGLLNPASPPSRFEPFRLKAIWNIARSGLQKLKQAIAGGQYEFPQGIFFGGHGPSESMRIVQANCDEWIGDSRRVIHIDLHTGLGPFGTYKLLLNGQVTPTDLAWYTNAFGDSVEATANAAQHKTAYVVAGEFGAWMQDRFRDRDYRFVCAEFGTYDVIRVLAAIRAENRAHHFAAPDAPVTKTAKQELMECFCPHSSVWRTNTLSDVTQIIDRASAAMG